MNLEYNATNYESYQTEKQKASYQSNTILHYKISDTNFTLLKLTCASVNNKRDFVEKNPNVSILPNLDYCRNLLEADIKAEALIRSPKYLGPFSIKKSEYDFSPRSILQQKSLEATFSKAVSELDSYNFIHTAKNIDDYYNYLVDKGWDKESALEEAIEVGRRHVFLVLTFMPEFQEYKADYEFWKMIQEFYSKIAEHPGFAENKDELIKSLVVPEASKKSGLHGNFIIQSWVLYKMIKQFPTRTLEMLRECWPYGKLYINYKAFDETKHKNNIESARILGYVNKYWREKVSRKVYIDEDGTLGTIEDMLPLKGSMFKVGKGSQKLLKAHTSKVLLEVKGNLDVVKNKMIADVLGINIEDLHFRCRNGKFAHTSIYRDVRGYEPDTTVARNKALEFRNLRIIDVPPETTPLEQEISIERHENSVTFAHILHQFIRTCVQDAKKALKEEISSRRAKKASDYRRKNKDNLDKVRSILRFLAEYVALHAKDHDFDKTSPISGTFSDLTLEYLYDYVRRRIKCTFFELCLALSLVKAKYLEPIPI